jgi:CubicO group peptidase (beta-lactamase class C family)
MKKISLCLSIILLSIITVWGQVIVAGTPESGGFSSERLKLLDNSMNEWVQKGFMNGGVGLVIRNGRIVYYKAVGYNDVATKEPMKKDAIFRIASQTKAITSVAIMILFDEGKLLLTDPVSKYIPSFKKQQVLDKFNAADTTYTTLPATREITIRDLLTHTSGIGYANIGSKEANAIYAKSGITAGIGAGNESLLATMTRLGTLPLMHQPGQKWTYGLNTDLLGCLVEVISGKPLDEFFRTKIFDPLGMKDTYFNIPANKASKLVNIHYQDSTGAFVRSGNHLLAGPVSGDYPLIPHTYFSGGAGLSSPIMDYAIFLQMLLNGGEYNGKRILGRNTVRMMTMNQIGEIAFSDRFGLGFLVQTEKNGNVPAQPGTYSWGGAFATSYWVDPKENMVMLFYRQLEATTQGHVVEKFRALTYQALK